LFAQRDVWRRIGGVVHEDIEPAGSALDPIDGRTDLVAGQEVEFDRMPAVSRDVRGVPSAGVDRRAEIE
jgi:hypothetical protein